MNKEPLCFSLRTCLAWRTVLGWCCFKCTAHFSGAFRCLAFEPGLKTDDPPDSGVSLPNRLLQVKGVAAVPPSHSYRRAGSCRACPYTYKSRRHLHLQRLPTTREPLQPCVCIASFVGTEVILKLNSALLIRSVCHSALYHT